MREKWSLRVIGDAECRPPEDNEAASHSQTQNNQHDLATTLPGLKLVYRNSSTLCSERHCLRQAASGSNTDVP